MQELFQKIFRYIPRDTSIKLYGLSHILYIVVIISIIIALCLLFNKKSEQTKQRVINITAILIIGSYFFDFIVQPIWAGELLLSKLPFHLCTAVGCLIPLITFFKKFKFLEKPVVIWAILAPLIFIFAPLNYINVAVEPYSYPIVQTFFYHGAEVFWGVFMLTSGKVKLDWKSVWQPVVGLFPMALWGTFGNVIYGDKAPGESFMFLKTDISSVAPQWMYIPALIIAACLGTALIYLIYNLIQKHNTKKALKN